MFQKYVSSSCSGSGSGDSGSGSTTGVLLHGRFANFPPQLIPDLHQNLQGK